MNVGKTTSECVISALKSIFAIEGLPVTIVTDGGPQFTSKQFENFCSDFSIFHVQSPSFHPASNGEAERFVQTLKNGLRKNCSGERDILPALQKLLATYRCSPHPSLDWKTPAEILHGRQPRNLLTLCSPLSDFPVSKPAESSGHFQLGSAVYARNYARGPKWVQGVVTKVLGRVTFIIETDHGLWRRHKNQLQPRLLESENKTSPSPNVGDPIVQYPEAAASGQSRNEAPPIERSTEKPSSSSVPNERRYPLRARKQTQFYQATF